MAFSYPKLFYDNRLADGTPAASSTATNYDVLNLIDLRPYTWWKPSAMPATVTIDCGAPAAADYWAVWGHDLATQGATIELRGSTDNFAVSNVLVDTLTPATDDPFVRVIASTSYRYWRLRVTGANAPSLAIALIGAALPIPAYLADPYDPTGREVMGDVNRSVKGHPLGRVYDFEDFSRRLRFELVTWDWVDDTWQPAWDAHLRDSPHIFAWDIGDHPDHIYLVNTGKKYDAPRHPGEWADLSYEVEGVVP